MKKICLILFILISLQSWAAIPTIKEVRVLYQKAATEKSSCIRLLSLLENCQGENVILSGYKACANMIMAKHVINPIKKLSLFISGKQTLEGIIQNNRNNIELRYLRLTIQSNSPSFLNYRNAINSDKQYIIQTLSTVQDEQLKTLITSYLQQLTINQ